MNRGIPFLAVVAVLIPTSAALAEPMFGLPSDIVLEPGMSVDVPVTAIGIGSEPIQGMELFVELDVPIELTNIDVHSGTIWGPGDPIVLQVCTYFGCPSDPGLILDPQHGYAQVGLTTPIVMPNTGVVARLTIHAPADTPVGTVSTLKLEWPDMGLRSHFFPESMIEPNPLPTSLIRVVPEPATALLLLAALPLLRRRNK